MIRIFTSALVAAALCLFNGQSAFAFDVPQNVHVKSPDGTIDVAIQSENGLLSYTISREGQPVLTKSKIGLITDKGDFSKNLTVANVSPSTAVTDQYRLLTIKRRDNIYKGNQLILHCKNTDQKTIDIIFRVSDDGVAFRYYFPGKSGDVLQITEEATTFHFNQATKGWLQPMSEAKSGWAKANPSYEEYYQKGVSAGTPSPIPAGWVFPALFNTGANWVLITETFPVEGNYCATHLKAQSPDAEYQIALADRREVFTNGISGPSSKRPWATPWRIITIGSLKKITESTLGTDLAAPSVKVDTSIIKPGKASWSWVLLKDGKPSTLCKNVL